MYVQHISNEKGLSFTSTTYLQHINIMRGFCLCFSKWVPLEQQHLLLRAPKYCHIININIKIHFHFDIHCSIKTKEISVILNPLIQKYAQYSLESQISKVHTNNGTNFTNMYLTCHERCDFYLHRKRLLPFGCLDCNCPYY